MTRVWVRLGLALGVSVLLHLVLLLAFRTPASPPSVAGIPMNVLIQPFERPAAPPAELPPPTVTRSKPQHRVERKESRPSNLPAGPIPQSARVGPSMSVTAGPISKARVPAESQLADAATYTDADKLADWPKLVGRVSAVYPARAYQERRKGVVVLQLMIDESGNVAEALALPGADEDLTQAALSALRPARFRPARGPEGKPVRSRVFFEVSFVLE